jgi:Flp pilus assembly protein TadD
MGVPVSTDFGRQHQLNLRVLRFQTNPEVEEPVMLAQDLLAVGRPEDAIEVVDFAIQRDPNDADLIMTLGVALLKSGEHEWARRILTKAVTADPEWIEPWRWLGEALLRADDLGRAGRVLARAKALGDEDAELTELLSRVRRLERLRTRALSYLNDPNADEPALLGQELLAAFRVEEAALVVAAALRSDADDPDLLVLAGRIERARGNVSAARRSLARAAQIDPMWDEAWSDLEELFEEEGDREGAARLAHARRAAESKAQADMDAEAETRTEAKQAAKLAAKLADEAARAEAKATIAAAIKAKADADAIVKANAAKTKAAVDAKARAEAKNKERELVAQAKLKAAAEKEAKRLAAAEAKGRAEAKARAAARAEERAQAKAEAEARAQAALDAEPIFELVHSMLRADLPHVPPVPSAPGPETLDTQLDDLLASLDPLRFSDTLPGMPAPSIEPPMRLRADGARPYRPPAPADLFPQIATEYGILAPTDAELSH